MRLPWLAHDEAPGPYITIPQYQFNRTKQHTQSHLSRLGLCQRKRFSQKQGRLKSTPSTRERSCIRTCMRIWLSPYETVGDSSDEGDGSHWIVLLCERYLFAGVGGRSSARRASGGQDCTCELGAHTERVVSSVKICRLWC